MPREHKAASLRANGIDAQSKGENRSAIAFFSQALEALPTSSTILLLRARAFIATDDATKGLDDATSSVRLDPSNPEGHFLCGKTLYILGQHKDALTAFLISLSITSASDQRTEILNAIVDTLAQLCKKSRKTLEEKTDEKGDGNRTWSYPNLTELVQLYKNLRSTLPSTPGPRNLLDTNIDGELIAEEFQCLLCLSLLFQPVTAVCGHTFCRVCLARALDHNNVCPHCRASLSEHISMQRQDTNTCLTSLLQKCCPNEWEERNALFR